MGASIPRMMEARRHRQNNEAVQGRLWPDAADERTGAVDTCPPQTFCPKRSSDETERIIRSVASVFFLGFIFYVLQQQKRAAEKTSVEKPPAETPRAGEFLLYMILPRNEREYLIGDLAEEYSQVRSKFGKGAADVWYYKQVAGSAWPLIKKAVRWGVIASAGEWVRRHLS